MKPLVEGLEKQYGDKVEFRRLNVDGSDNAAMAIANKLGVQYVPTFVYATKDGVVSGTVVGEQTTDQLKVRLDALK
ncbi:MAG: thioredoxin domain-containing protein [Coriobacteriia bacterium]|nr:thioredoxin domain-containing protein [Coriobacteriia bacterium]